MANTVDRIVDASHLPLSIVIVGVGGADFTNMVSIGIIMQGRCTVRSERSSSSMSLIYAHTGTHTYMYMYMHTCVSTCIVVRL